MTQLRRLPALAAALALLACPAGALAQGEGDNPPPLNDKPPSSLEGENTDRGRDGADSGSAQSAAPAPAAEPQLAATGSETWLVALAGAGLLLTGLGLRLRLTPQA